LEHAQGGDESARLSGADVYHHCFAPPLWLSRFDESSDDVSRARLYYHDFAALTRACSLRARDCVSQAGGRCREPVAAFVAIDWSDAKHDICLLDVATGKQEASLLKHTPEALEAWATAWRTRVAGPPIAVCLEPSRGPLIYTLLKDDFLVLYPINPATLAKYREAFSPSRAKDDPQAADYLLEVLLHHRDRLKAWRPDHAKTRTRPYLVEPRRRLVHDRTRSSHRMTALLKAYVPQALQGFGDIRTLLVGDGLLRGPTVEALKKVRPSTLETCLHEHHAVRKEPIAHRMAAIKEAIPLGTDQAVIHASVLMIKALAPQMKTTIEAIREFDQEIEQRCRTHADDPLFASLPGAGPVSAARLTAAMGTVRDRWTTVEERLCYSGVAPVRERRGKSRWIRWRYCWPKFLRQSCQEYAGESIHHSFWARAYDMSQRARGKSHQAAVRALAFKWIRII
jgi:transposase